MLATFILNLPKLSNTTIVPLAHARPTMSFIYLVDIRN